MVLWVFSAAWFAHMSGVHFKCHGPTGPTLRRWDWRLRFALIMACFVSGAWSLATGWPFSANWLACKVMLFGGMMSCGIGIRHYVQKVHEVWPMIAADRTTDAIEHDLRTAMWRGTWTLWGLWFLPFVIGWLGVVQPELWSLRVIRSKPACLCTMQWRVGVLGPRSTINPGVVGL